MIKQGTEEWFKARVGKLTASRVPAALNNSPWKDYESLMREMVREMHGFKRDDFTNPAMKYGTEMEPKARHSYEMQTGDFVQAGGFHVLDDWKAASPDGLIGSDGLLEIKCPYHLRDASKAEFKRIELQTHYYDQVQWQLHVTGRKWCAFMQWNQGGSTIEMVEPDPEWLEHNLPRLEVFMGRLWSIVDDEVRSSVYLEESHQQLVPADHPELEKLASAFHEQMKIYKDAEAKLRTLKKHILEQVGHQSSEMSGPYRLRITAVPPKNRVDYKQACLDQAIDLSAYEKETKPSYRVSI